MNKIINDGFKADSAVWLETGEGKGLARNTQDHIFILTKDDVIIYERGCYTHGIWKSWALGPNELSTLIWIISIVS